MCVLAFIIIDKRMQCGLDKRQRGYQGDQHLNKARHLKTY